MHKYSKDNTNSCSTHFKRDLKLQCMCIALRNLLIPELNSLINTSHLMRILEVLSLHRYVHSQLNWLQYIFSTSINHVLIVENQANLA